MVTINIIQVWLIICNHRGLKLWSFPHISNTSVNTVLCLFLCFLHKTVYYAVRFSCVVCGGIKITFSSHTEVGFSVAALFILGE